MCLLLIALDVVPRRPLLLLGNRDEFHARPAAVAAPWCENAGVVGGRDLEAGGSWLAIRRDGRFAAVTNVRLADPKHGPRSRGELVGNFVLGDATPADYAAQIASRVCDYAPFNLVIGDGRGVWCIESQRVLARRLSTGIHVVSNGPLDAPWPKMQRLRSRFETALAAGRDDGASMLDLLADETRAPESALPDTGIDHERERWLSSIFVRGDTYGTRASTLAWRDAAGGIGLHERRFGPLGAVLGEDRCTLD